MRFGTQLFLICYPCPVQAAAGNIALLLLHHFPYHAGNQFLTSLGSVSRNIALVLVPWSSQLAPSLNTTSLSPQSPRSGQLQNAAITSDAEPNNLNNSFRKPLRILFNPDRKFRSHHQQITSSQKLQVHSLSLTLKL